MQFIAIKIVLQYSYLHYIFHVDCPENCGQRGCYTKRTQQGLEEKFCCHEHCLGGCYGATPEDCIACEHVFYQGMCQTSCPSNTYKVFSLHTVLLSHNLVFSIYS